MHSIAQPSGASTATPLPVEQSISAHLTVETMVDAGNGGLMLTSAVQSNAGDLQEVTPAQALAKIAATRAALDQQEALVLTFQRQAVGNRTRTFEDLTSGQRRSFTCYRWCDSDHLSDTNGPSRPDEVSCTSYDKANDKTLPVGDDSDLSGAYVLSTLIQVDHFHDDPARRMPHAVVEIVEDHFTDTLDADQLQSVIDLFDERVAAMRTRHAELVRMRAEFPGHRA